MSHPSYNYIALLARDTEKGQRDSTMNLSEKENSHFYQPLYKGYRG